MIPAITAGSEGTPILLVAGPPLSARVFREVQARLLPRRTLALELIEAPVEGIDALTEALQQTIQRTGAKTLVACGLAIPLALTAGASTLVVCCGPIARLEPITAAMARLPAPILAETLLRRRILLRWLASSIGLRRLVVNPYVMDHDTVAALLEPLLRTRETRQRTAAWIRDLPKAVAAPSFRGDRLIGIWGSNDRIYPLSKAKMEIEALGGEGVIPIPGGRHLMVEERPWSLADTLIEVLK